MFLLRLNGFITAKVVYIRSMSLNLCNQGIYNYVYNVPICIKYVDDL